MPNKPITLRSRFIIFLLALAVFSTNVQAQSKHTFALGDTDFLLDGKPLQMISGEMHCARIPKEYWRDRMKMAKSMGLNTIGTYVFWNAHENVQGQYDFTGNNNIAEFIKIAQQEGLWVVLRPSPYACAEWEFGGYPWWLLKDSTIKVRSHDPKFIGAYKKYISQLAKQLVPLLVTHGGNVLMVQFENEYGSYSDDKSYLELNRKIFKDAGFDGIFFTCDGADQMPKGYLPGYLPAVNGLEDPVKVKELINKYHNGRGPYYIAEWYPGWFDHWGDKKHAKTNIDEATDKLDKILAAGISVNMYMFHGGTTRNFMNGANMNKTEPYAPQVSSYDYDAPLDEAGNPTAKFLKFRAVIAKHLPTSVKLPAIPARKATIAITNIKLTAFADLFNNLPQPVLSKKPLCFEELDQGYGFVLYRTRISKSGILKISALRDHGIVYMNGKKIAVLDRRSNQDSVALKNVAKDAVLDILVENNGRINYGPYLTDNRQGITQKVTLQGAELIDWAMYKLPFNDLGAFRFSAQAVEREMPALYRGTFRLTNIGDTYLDMRSFGKGFVFLNGHNLGKYWNIGPQQTIYVPAVWLKKGKNEVTIFDDIGSGHTKLSTLNQPILDNKLTTSQQ